MRPWSIVGNVWSLYSRNILTEIRANIKSNKLLNCLQTSMTRSSSDPRQILMSLACRVNVIVRTLQALAYSQWRRHAKLHWYLLEFILCFSVTRPLSIGVTRIAEEGRWEHALQQGSCGIQLLYTCAPLIFNGLQARRIAFYASDGGASFKNRGPATLIYLPPLLSVPTQTPKQSHCLRKPASTRYPPSSSIRSHLSIPHYP